MALTSKELNVELHENLSIIQENQESIDNELIDELSDLFVEPELIKILFQFIGKTYVITPPPTNDSERHILFPVLGGCYVFVNEKQFYVPVGYMFSITNLPRKIKKIIIVSSLKLNLKISSQTDHYMSTIFESYEKNEWYLSSNKNKKIKIEDYEVYIIN